MEKTDERFEDEELRYDEIENEPEIDVDKLTKDFLAKGGKITKCPDVNFEG